MKPRPDSDGNGACTLRLPFRPEVTQQRGELQGGVVTVYADAAMAIPTMPEQPDDVDLVSTDLHMQFIRPVTRGPIIARGSATFMLASRKGPTS